MTVGTHLALDLQAEQLRMMSLTCQCQHPTEKHALKNGARTFCTAKNCRCIRHRQPKTYR